MLSSNSVLISASGRAGVGLIGVCVWVVTGGGVCTVWCAGCSDTAAVCAPESAGCSEQACRKRSTAKAKYAGLIMMKLLLINNGIMPGIAWHAHRQHVDYSNIL